MFDKPVRIHFNFRFFQMTLETSNKSKKKNYSFCWEILKLSLQSLLHMKVLNGYNR